MIVCHIKIVVFVTMFSKSGNWKIDSFDGAILWKLI
jgi:hypothetical protein